MTQPRVLNEQPLDLSIQHTRSEAFAVQGPRGAKILWPESSCEPPSRAVASKRMVSSSVLCLPPRGGCNGARSLRSLFAATFAPALCPFRAPHEQPTLPPRWLTHFLPMSTQDCLGAARVGRLSADPCAARDRTPVGALVCVVDDPPVAVNRAACGCRAAGTRTESRRADPCAAANNNAICRRFYFKY